MLGYSGRMSCRPSGVYASSLRRRLLAVYLLTILSIHPAETPKNNRGRPSFFEIAQIVTPVRLGNNGHF